MQNVKVFTKEKNKASMYNIIHANQWDRQWKLSNLFQLVYQVDKHEKYKS